MQTQKTKSDRVNQIKWRIAELESDIEVLALRETSASDEARPGYTKLIDLCYATIDRLKEQL